MNSLAFKNARMELKTTKNQKDMLNSAAALSGQDLTAFVLASAEARAKSVLSEYQSLNLLQKEQTDFMAALTKPAKPTKALKGLMSKESLVER